LACPQCGVPPGAGNDFCPECGADALEIAVICVKCGAAFEKPSQNIDNSQKLSAGVCALLLGCFGVHKFILGYKAQGIVLLLTTLLSLFILAFVTGIIGFIEGIIYLTKTDEEFERIYIKGRRPWF